MAYYIGLFYTYNHKQSYRDSIVLIQFDLQVQKIGVDSSIWASLIEQNPFIALRQLIEQYCCFGHDLIGACLSGHRSLWLSSFAGKSS
jgi:hypothetical protein